MPTELDLAIILGGFFWGGTRQVQHPAGPPPTPHLLWGEGGAQPAPFFNPAPLSSRLVGPGVLLHMHFHTQCFSPITRKKRKLCRTFFWNFMGGPQPDWEGLAGKGAGWLGLAAPFVTLGDSRPAPCLSVQPWPRLFHTQGDSRPQAYKRLLNSQVVWSKQKLSSPHFHPPLLVACHPYMQTSLWLGVSGNGPPLVDGCE